METAIESFRDQRPFLAEFASLSRELRPAAQELPRSLPDLNDALVVGQPVLRRSVDLNEKTEDVFRVARRARRRAEHAARARERDRRRLGHAAADRVRRPVPDGLQLLELLLGPARRAPVGGDGLRHGRAGDPEGGSEPHPGRPLVAARDNDRPMDIPADIDPDEATGPARRPARRRCTASRTRSRSTRRATPTARSASGATSTGRSSRATAATRLTCRRATRAATATFLGGGSHIVVDRDIPGNRGPTWLNLETKDQLGPKSIADVDRWHP